MLEISPRKRLSGEITVPGDKSVSHRAVLFGSIADGVTKISNFLNGQDCVSTISCFKSMGIDIKTDGYEVCFRSRNARLKAPDTVLYTEIRKPQDLTGLRRPEL